MAATFNDAWQRARRGEYSGLFASEELYGRRYSGRQSGYKTMTRHKPTPLLKLQNKARADFHASNVRAHNGAIDKLELWARQARYGG
jgi:hypothetical protein